MEQVRTSPHPLPERGFDFVGQSQSLWEVALGAGQGTDHFVDGHDGVDRNAGVHRFEDGFVVEGIEIMAGDDEGDSRTNHPRVGDERTGFDAIRLRLIARRQAAGGIDHHGDYPDRFPPQIRPRLLLAGSKIAVKIQKQPADPSVHNGIHT